MNNFKVGDRVRLKIDADRFPDFILKAGATGVVKEIRPGIAWVAMDSHFPELIEWSNNLNFTADEIDELELIP